MEEPSRFDVPADSELVRRVREGDERAMDLLVARHYSTVFRLALRMMGNEEAAADVVQESFLKALRAIHGFRGESSFRTWLLAIAANEARGAMRRGGRRRETGLEDATDLPDGNPLPDETLSLRQERKRISKLIASLPEKQREAVTLRIFEGLSFREIGILLGSSEGAARVNYHHGLKRLREMMG